jgi:hypothetical protein
MADRMKDHDNKDAQESGRPVQLDREQQGGKPGQQQGGQPEKPQHDKQGTEPAPRPGQPGQPQPNR